MSSNHLNSNNAYVKSLSLKIGSLYSFQKEQMRDLQQEVEYMQDESENIQSIRESLPDVCTKNSDRCLENDC